MVIVIFYKYYVLICLKVCYYFSPDHVILPLYCRYELKGDEEEQIARLAEDGDIYSKLARSLAPEIFGHEDIKKALLLLLVGAPHRKLKDGMKVMCHTKSCLDLYFFSFSYMSSTASYIIICLSF